MGSGRLRKAILIRRIIDCSKRRIVIGYWAWQRRGGVSHLLGGSFVIWQMSTADTASTMRGIIQGRFVWKVARAKRYRNLI